MEKNQNNNNNMFNIQVQGEGNKITIKGNAPKVKTSVSGKKNVIRTKNK